MLDQDIFTENKWNLQNPATKYRVQLMFWVFVFFFSSPPHPIKTSGNFRFCSIKPTGKGGGQEILYTWHQPRVNRTSLACVSQEESKSLEWLSTDHKVNCKIPSLLLTINCFLFIYLAFYMTKLKMHALKDWKLNWSPFCSSSLKSLLKSCIPLPWQKAKWGHGKNFRAKLYQKFKNTQILDVNFSKYHKKDQKFSSEAVSIQFWHFRSLQLSADLRIFFNTPLSKIKARCMFPSLTLIAFLSVKLYEPSVLPASSLMKNSRRYLSTCKW